MPLGLLQPIIGVAFCRMQPFFNFMAKSIVQLELTKHFQHQILSCPHEVICEVFNEVHQILAGEIEEFTNFYVCSDGKLRHIDINQNDVKFLFI